ncbi:Photosystem I assembly protein Ycf3 [Maioricimonas rarisocia]|uniref:Photosystem I assembly protein Ycf3 n=1 Tax=Maioricimonas rarisocia TaxID=2528026 RepID=A0A517Z0E5_9PLAN|nr:CHAT domain-containing tetratricopeptide repeat protein [Maioricimonas rarisocia]QDU35960.1 Photosystem I assembly protein Ycf3 [Maioricimonas rarisocia]
MTTMQSTCVDITARRKRPPASVAAGLILAFCGGLPGLPHPVEAADADRVVALYQQGLVLYEKGDFARAADVFGEAVSRAPGAFGRGERGPVHMDTVRLMEFQANCYLSSFDLFRAESLYRECIEVARQEEGPQSAMIHRCLGNLGVLYTRLAQWDRAEEQFQTSLRSDTDAENRARTHLNLASMYLLSDQTDQAERAYRTSFSYWRSQKGETARKQMASCQHGLGMNAFKRGDRNRAAQLFRQALATRRELLPANHRFVAHSTEMLGTTQAVLGRSDEGIELLRDARQMMTAFWGTNHVELAEVEHELALALARKGEAVNAAEAMTRSRRMYREYIGRILTGLSQEEQLRFLAEERNRFMDSLALARTHRREPRMIQASFDWVLNGKGLAQETLAERHLLARNAAIDPALKSLASELKAARQQLAALSSSGNEKDVADTVRRLNEREADLARQLTLQSGPGNGTDRWVTSGHMLQVLPEDAALVEFAWLDREEPAVSAFDRRPRDGRQGRLVAWTLVAKTRTVRLYDLGAVDEVLQRVEAVRQQIRSSEDDIAFDPESATESMNKSLKEAAQQLLWPMLQDLSDAERWVISPDGPLWLLPWNALITPSGKYAVEEATISLVVSGRQLLWERRHSPREYSAIMADPDFDLAPTAVAATINRVQTSRPASSATRGGESLLADYPRELLRLRATVEEGKHASEIIAESLSERVYFYRRELALETYFKLIQSPRIWVLATHGFFLDGTTSASGHALLRCGLTLAGANRRETQGGDSDDGILTGLEVLDADLRGTELVVLSACDTAVGEATIGEGIAGLQHAFQLAGAGQVIATLWKVPDAETASVMKTFWTRLPTARGASAALRAAQLRFIEEDRRNGGFAHPWHWAAAQLSLQGPL